MSNGNINHFGTIHPNFLTFIPLPGWTLLVLPERAKRPARWHTCTDHASWWGHFSAVAHCSQTGRCDAKSFSFLWSIIACFVCSLSTGSLWCRLKRVYYRSVPLFPQSTVFTLTGRVLCKNSLVNCLTCHSRVHPGWYIPLNDDDDLVLPGKKHTQNILQLRIPKQTWRALPCSTGDVLFQLLWCFSFAELKVDSSNDGESHSCICSSLICSNLVIAI